MLWSWSGDFKLLINVKAHSIKSVKIIYDSHWSACMRAMKSVTVSSIATAVLALALHVSVQRKIVPSCLRSPRLFCKVKPMQHVPVRKFYRKQEMECVQRSKLTWSCWLTQVQTKPPQLHHANWLHNFTMQSQTTTGFALQMALLPASTVICQPTAVSQAGLEQPSSTWLIAASLVQMNLQRWTILESGYVSEGRTMLVTR